MPAAAGIGLRSPHLEPFLADRPEIGWLEVHAENHMAPAALAPLKILRQDYPISLHCVALSLGSAEGINREHLARVEKLTQILEPAEVSDHLSFSVVSGRYFNDLLPLPYTDEVLDIFANNVLQVQDVLKRRILIENPSLYLKYNLDQTSEPEFLNLLVEKTGCGLLLDLNNLVVNHHNFGWDLKAYLQTLRTEAVAELHLAGHSINDADGVTIRIDDHGSPASAETWEMLGFFLEKFGPRPCLFEWDSEIPPLSELLEQAGLAQQMLDRYAAC